MTVSKSPSRRLVRSKTLIIVNKDDEYIYRFYNNGFLKISKNKNYGSIK